MVGVPTSWLAYEKGMIDSEGLQAVQPGSSPTRAHGRQSRHIGPAAALNAQQIRGWRQRTRLGYDSKQAVLYWPWVKVFDPPTGNKIFVPPSGHMAGIWARNDSTRAACTKLRPMRLCAVPFHWR